MPDGISRSCSGTRWPCFSGWASPFLSRLTASPMTAADFLLGYLLPMLPMAAGQSVICMGAAVLALAVVLFRWKMVER